MRSRYALPLFLLVAAAVPAAAQNSQSVPATASVNLLASLTLTKVSDLNFGNHFASEGTIYATGPAWSGTTDVGNAFSVSFAIPSVLTKAGGATVPFGCGSTSGTLQGTGADLTFDPNVGVASATQGSSGQFGVLLGVFTADPTGRCSTTLTGKPAGLYTGSITLTVAVL